MLTFAIFKFTIMRLLFIFLFTFSYFQANSQTQPAASSAKDRVTSAQIKLKQAPLSIYANIEAENIGPTVQSGRVVDLEVNPENPHIFYVAYASGGLWKTVNNGASFEPLFQHEMVMTIGDFDINWKTNEIWLGTGEVNSSRSSYSGVGMFNSKDGGKTWKHKGLSDTHHIGKVIIDKNNPGTILVASLGHLYSSNNARGVFKSIDNGENWIHALSISADVGVVDMIQDPRNQNILYAASWERTRRAWDFKESGEGSAIYKSEDAGSTWKKVSGKKSGFPSTQGTGRIGLNIAYDGDQPVIYALLDNYNRRPNEKKEKEGLEKDDFKTMSQADFLKIKEEDLKEFLENNGFPDKYTTSNVIESIKSGKVKVSDIASYLEDANKLLFDTPVIAAELYRSDDSGKTWNKTHEEYLDRVYNSYGYYFGLVRAAPSDPNTVYIAGVPLLRSDDGGKTFINVSKPNVHADHHSLWINPENKLHIINGNDGGVNISYDAGANYYKCNSPTVGQFYAINVDYADEYNVYGGLQDNGVWMGSHNYREGVAWHQSGHYPYKSIMGGDGMQIQIDKRDNSTTYTGFQFGNYFRINTKNNNRSYITPKHELGDAPYRWNWQAPILLSSHNQDIFYMGSNKLLRSMNQGDDFKVISEDLTRGGKKGDVAYGTLTSISESEQQFGLIYTGSDDGMVHRTDDGGVSWIDLTEGLEGEFWVSRIEASLHDKDVVYVSLNGYRWDDFRSLVYRSENRGNTWTAIGSNLPMEPVNVIKEDPVHKNILYVGTDHGTYISNDTGISFQLLSNDIPKVAVHDLVIHRKANHLLIGTHGRSIYKMDLAPIYDVQNNEGKALIVKSKTERRASSNWGNKNWMRQFNKPENKLYIYSDSAGSLQVQTKTSDDQLLKTTTIEIPKGFSYYIDDLTIDSKKEKTLRKFLEKNKPLQSREDDKTYLIAGSYKYVFTINGKTSESTLTLK